MQTTGSEPSIPTAEGGEEQAIKVASDLASTHAPWRADISWQVVLAQGIVLAVLGLVIWLAPGTGGTLVLQLLGIVLLATAAVSAWRLLRGSVAPARVGPIAFRCGVGLSVGLVVVIGSLIAEGGDVVTIALAIVLGIGLLLYALSLLASAFVRREPDAGVPWVGVAIAIAAGAVGLLLILNARSGIDSLKGAFAILGIVLLVAGVVICGRALMLRSNDQTEPAD